MLWKKAQEKTVKSHLSPVKICGIIKTHLLRGVSILPLGKGKSAYNLQRYRSGHNGADSKSSLTKAREKTENPCAARDCEI